jgi:hypothetical protein
MARHAKTDSDVTSLAASTPPRSPRGRPAYYVLSPAASHPDFHLGASGRAAEKMSLAGSTPAESPLHYHFHHHRHNHSGGGAAGGGGGGGVHHSRESSTGRLLFSDQLRSGGDVAAVVSAPWRRLAQSSGAGSVGDDDDEDASLHGGLASSQWRCYALGALAFVAVFAFFLLVLWGASRSYKPHVVVKVRSSSLSHTHARSSRNKNYLFGEYSAASITFIKFVLGLGIIFIFKKKNFKIRPIHFLLAAVLSSAPHSMSALQPALPLHLKKSVPLPFPLVLTRFQSREWHSKFPGNACIY